MTKHYPGELRERAIRLVLDSENESGACARALSDAVMTFNVRGDLSKDYGTVPDLPVSHGRPCRNRPKTGVCGTVCGQMVGLNSVCCMQKPLTSREIRGFQLPDLDSNQEPAG